jgi:lipopolysaccharide transport system ATP-binding protein
MSNLALRVDGLSKRYSLTTGGGAHLRHAFYGIARRAKAALLGRSVPPGPPTDDQEFFALRDISFEVQHGERVGIIGRNGAGKSTLLKILSRITKPTSGYAEVHGRLGALLEVGTGFHPELSGRENIYLNATILGMKKADVDRRFDEIVAFAEVEKFIDMPVKHYSSGMFMRLAFSVSAHLEPDILVLDEVLAVGDAAFQQKCLGKMDGVAKQGRTVLFVSHSVPSIVAFCNRCILLDQGTLLRDGPVADVTEFYQERLSALSERSADIVRAELTKTNRARFTSIKVRPLGPDGEPQSLLRVGQDLEIETTVVAEERIAHANVAIVIFEPDGHRLIDANMALKNDYLSLEPGEQATIRFTLKNVLLKPDTYRVALWLGRRPIEDIDMIPDAARFTVDVDPRRTTHFQIYPAPYQCEFTYEKSVSRPRTVLEATGSSK